MHIVWCNAKGCEGLADIDVDPHCKRCGKDLTPKYYVPTPRKPIPRCPVCGSADLTKITLTHKVVKVAALGIFGTGDNGKTWKCKSCGSKF